MICDCGNDVYLLEMCYDCYMKWVAMLELEVKIKLEVNYERI